MLNFEIPGIELDLSVMRISYKLEKRTTTEKLEKFLKINKIKNCFTICYNNTAWRNIIQSFLNFELMEPLSILQKK